MGGLALRGGLSPSRCLPAQWTRHPASSFPNSDEAGSLAHGEGSTVQTQARLESGPHLQSSGLRTSRSTLKPADMSSDLPPLPLEPRPGRYRHYKGREYHVLGIARHSETLETLVVYQALYGERGLWVRPAAMFIETIATPAGERVPRFAFVAAE